MSRDRVPQSSSSPHGDGYQHQKYDPSDFIVPATDSKGHSERVWCRITPAMDRALDTIVSSRRWPFRTKGDVVRWAIATNIRRLEAMEPIGSVSAQVDAISAIIREDQFHQEFVQTFDALNRSISTHLSAGAEKEAIRLVATIKAQMERMPEGYWRDRYLAEMGKKFGHLLGGKPRPGITGRTA